MPSRKPPRPPRDAPRCPGAPERNVACTARLKPGETHCYNHDPARYGERAAAARLARGRKPGDLGSELGTYDGLARRAAKVLAELEEGFLVEDEDGETKWVSNLEPKLAVAQLNALRLLAALVKIRTAEKGKKTNPFGADAPTSLADIA